MHTDALQLPRLCVPRCKGVIQNKLLLLLLLLLPENGRLKGAFTSPPGVFRVNFTFSLNISCVYGIKQKIALHCLTAVFSTFTHTQTRGLLEKVWFEYDSSGINWSMSGV